LANQVPDYLEENELGQLEKKEGTPTEVQIVSVRQWVEETVRWKEKNPEIYQQRIEGFNAGLSEDIERKEECFADPQRYQKGWIKGFLKVDRILKAFNPQVGIDVDGLLDRIDVGRCPAVNLYWKVREKRMRSGNPPEDNDVDDYMFLPVIPYADIVLTERNLRAFILQADETLQSKVFYRAANAVENSTLQGYRW
jgi:hypothetical protein